MNLVKSGKAFMSKHGSTMCVVGVFLGLGLTIYETWKARPKVDKIMAEHEAAVNDIKADASKTEEEVKKAVNGERVEMVKKVAITVTPMVVAGAATGGLAVAGHVMDARKIANMAATIEVGDIAYRKLEGKLSEVLGEEKAEEVKKEINEEKAREAVDRMVEEGGELSVIEQCRGGSQVYYDPFFDKLFKSDDHTIIETCLRLNNRMNNKPFEPYIGYNEFYDELGGSIPGASHYFKFDKDHQLEPMLCNTIKNGDISCIVLDWYIEPQRIKG